MPKLSKCIYFHAVFQLSNTLDIAEILYFVKEGHAEYSQAGRRVIIPHKITF